MDVKAVLFLAFLVWLWARPRKSRGKSMAMGSTGVPVVKPAPSKGVIRTQVGSWWYRKKLDAWRWLVGLVYRHRRGSWVLTWVSVWTFWSWLTYLGVPLSWSWPVLVLLAGVSWRLYQVLTESRRQDSWKSRWVPLSRDEVRTMQDGSRKTLPAPLFGTRVLSVEESERDVRLTVTADTAKQSYGSFEAAREQIARVLRWDLDLVSLEHVPGRDNSMAVVVLTRPEWAAEQAREMRDRVTRVYLLEDQALDPRTGLCEVAVRMDDMGPAQWKAFSPGVGAFHGVIAGDTRYGKSVFAETLAIVMCRSGIAAPAFIDLAGGVTFDEWAGKGVGFAASVDEAVVLLRALDREFEDRIARMRERHLKVAPIGEPGWPLIPVFVDEGPELKGSAEASRLLSKALRQWAKAGMCIVFASQNLTIESYLGKEAGSISKAQMMAHNVAVFYSNQGQAGLSFSIDDVPKVKGVFKLSMADSDDPPTLVRGLLSEGVPTDLPVARFTWPTERSLDSPELQPERPLRVVVPSAARELDPAERVKAVLREGPATVSEIVAATALHDRVVRRVLDKLPVRGDGSNYKQRYSLLEVQ